MENNKKQILIVCRGNILRSPFAEVVIKRKIFKDNLQNKFGVISRGIQGTKLDPGKVKFPNVTFYKEIFPLAKKSLEKYAVDLSHHVSKPVKDRDVVNSSAIFAMDTKTFVSLCRLFPKDVTKIHKLSEIIDSKEIDFNDPENTKDEEKYNLIFDKIFITIQNGFTRLISLANETKKL